MRVPPFFTRSTGLEVLLASTFLLNAVSAAPARIEAGILTPRANNQAGMGVEVEMGQILIQTKDKQKLPAKEREDMKGKPMTPVRSDLGKKTNWELTAETIGDWIIPEAIVDGLSNKVGKSKTKEIGQQIALFMDRWKPHNGDEVKIPGFDNFGPFTVRFPDTAYPSNKLFYATQVTTAMPLAAILEILRDSKNNNPNDLGSKDSRNRQNYQILTKENFASFKKIKESDITDEFLGFFSLLASYCKIAKDGLPAEGPKSLVSIMPRTDFTTQFNKFIEPKVREQLKETSLFEVIKKAINAGDGFATETFSWTPDAGTRPINDDWEGKDADLKSGKLEVRKFLNYLPQKDLVKLMDKALRHGQVGSLDDKMENLLDSDKAAPIFEFRDLGRFEGSEKFIEMMGKHEDKVVAYHRKFKDESVNNKPSKGKSLSIAMKTDVAPHLGSADVSNYWIFSTTSVGKAVGSCGETDGEKLTVQDGSSSTKLDPNTDPKNPPWPAGIYKLKIEGQDCEYKCDGANAGRLFCPNRQISCVEDSAKGKEQLKCGAFSFWHAVVYCDF